MNPSPLTPAPRPRGVYKCAGLTPETVVYLVHDSRGRQLGKIEVLTEFDTPDIPARVAAWLDAVDPVPRLGLLP